MKMRYFTESELDEIRDVALAATRGDWEASFSSYVFSGFAHTKICQLDCSHINNDNRENDSRFIALIDPETVLALISQLKSLRKQLESSEAHLEGFPDEYWDAIGIERP